VTDDELASLSLDRNGAVDQRAAGVAAAPAWLAERFLA
jgi:hypothetical protein